MQSVFKAAAAMTASLLLVISANAQLFEGKPRDFGDFGYFVRGAEWVFPEDKEKVIFVCFENPTDANKTTRDWIEDQVTQSWQKHSAITFRGWGNKCAEKNSGIRIVIKDDGARVLKFGKHIDGIPGGMILNDTFKNWNPNCKTMIEACVRSIAVHEFGHAIGFAHEQNRPDTPGECADIHGQGQLKEKMLTAYDPDSVMNYCNPVYNNNGNLSPKDIESVQKVYGKRS